MPQTRSQTNKKAEKRPYTPGSVVTHVTTNVDIGDKWCCRCDSGPELRWRKKGYAVLKCGNKLCNIYSHLKCFNLDTLPKSHLELYMHLCDHCNGNTTQITIPVAIVASTNATNTNTIAILNPPSPSPSPLSELIQQLTPSPQPTTLHTAPPIPPSITPTINDVLKDLNYNNDESSAMRLPPILIPSIATTKTKMPCVDQITNVQQRGNNTLETVAVFKLYPNKIITIPAHLFHQHIYNLNTIITTIKKDRKKGFREYHNDNLLDHLFNTGQIPPMIVPYLVKLYS